MADADTTADRAAPALFPTAPGKPPAPSAIVAAIMVGLGLAVFDPVGWDHFGPIRWLVVGALGYWVVALGPASAAVAKLGEVDRLGRAALGLWAALLVWGGVTAVAGADPLHAWIGTPDRRFGWLTWLLCGALFAVGTGSGPAERRLVQRGFAVGVTAMGVYTLVEWAGWAIDVTFAGDRLGGPFGQPAFLGAAAALATPIVLGLAADPSETRPWRIVAAVGAACGTLCLLGSQSRAAWLGVLVAGVVWLVTWVRRPQAAGPRSGRPDRRRRAMVAPLVVVAAPVAAILVIRPLRNRLTSSLDDRGVIAGRVDEWQVGLRALADAPLLGHGAEGYRTVFGANVDEQYVIDWGRDVITDRAHSGPLDVALAFGGPGGLLYLGLAAVVGFVAVRQLVASGPAGTGLAVGVLAYLVQQQVMFPLAEVDPLFWLAAGLLVASASQPAVGGAQAAPAPRRRGLAAGSVIDGLAIGLAIVITVGAALDVAANARLAGALDADEPEAALDRVAGAAALRPDSIRYLFIASRLASRSGDHDLALARIDDGLQLSAADPALLTERGAVQLDLARSLPAGRQRAVAIAEATATLEALVADDPHHPQNLQRLGIALALGGEVDEAISVLERAVTLAPDRSEPRRNLAEVRRLRETS